MSDAESGLLAFFPLPLLPRAVLCSISMLLSGLLLPLKPYPLGVSVFMFFIIHIIIFILLLAVLVARFGSITKSWFAFGALSSREMLLIALDPA